MNAEQITNIAIKIGELSSKTNITLLISIISAVAAIVSALTAGLFAYKLNVANKQHQKQWAYIAKVSLLIDNAIETFSRLLFNKLSIAYYNDNTARQNLFLLQKDIMVIESQLVVYASPELAEAVSEFKNIIIKSSNEEFLKQWSSIYQKGHELLLLCRKHLGIQISEKFQDFTAKLTEIPPKDPLGVVVSTDAMGSIMLTKPQVNK